MTSVPLGAILFQILKQKNDFNCSVSQVASTDFNHVGLVVSPEHVIEATPQHGVVVSRLNDFLSHSDVTCCATVKDLRRIPYAIDYAKNSVGLPYNHHFYSAQSSLYCSELIVNAFGCQYGEYFALYPMNFKHAVTGQLSSFWKAYYQQLNVDIPDGQLGSHPAQLLVQQHLFSSLYNLVSS